MGVEQLELVAVVGVLLIVASSYFAGKFGVATPIVLVLLGLGLSFLPGMRVRIERWLQRHHADSRFYAGNGLGLRGGAVIAWAGMRGVVTLAAAQSLPLDFPYRSQLVLLAFVVALVTLVGQGGTLPLLIRVLGIRGTDEEQAQRELSLLLGELREASDVQVLDNPDLKRRGGEPFDSAVLEKVRQLHSR
ncbi:MAG: cation:proton antiporter, partial [Brachybacterium sp.]